jgi:uncharacterized SAM-dependent methyltransferase
MHLFSLAKQVVRISRINLEVAFEQGESLHTENSYKYNVEDLRQLARLTGFHLNRTWYDKNQHFSSNLFTATKIEN